MGYACCSIEKISNANDILDIDFKYGESSKVGFDFAFQQNVVEHIKYVLYLLNRIFAKNDYIKRGSIYGEKDRKVYELYFDEIFSLAELCLIGQNATLQTTHAELLKLEAEILRAIAEENAYGRGAGVAYLVSAPRPRP